MSAENSSATSAYNWAKIVKAGSTYLVILPPRSIWLIKTEDQKRFSDWISQFSKSNPPNYAVGQTKDVQNPYKIVDLSSGAEFLLQKPAPPNDVWYLNLEDLRFGILAGLIDNGVALDSTDPYKKERSFWKLDVDDPKAFQHWRPGDSTIIGKVMVNSYSGNSAPVGYLLFRFETQENYIHWLSSKTNQEMGLWVHPR